MSYIYISVQYNHVCWVNHINIYIIVCTIKSSNTTISLRHVGVERWLFAAFWSGILWRIAL